MCVCVCVLGDNTKSQNVILTVKTAQIRTSDKRTTWKKIKDILEKKRKKKKKKKDKKEKEKRKEKE